MPSSHDESGDDTASSMGDSSYDFIDDRSNVTTDDEDQGALTASTTSSDGHAFEQVDRHDASEGDEPVNATSHVEAVSSEHGSLAHRNIPSAHEASLSASPQCESPETDEAIEFEEPSVTNLNSARFTEVSHTLNIVEKRHAPGVTFHEVSDRAQDQIAITVRQTMTSHSLSLENGTYKVLFVGDQELRDPLIKKIGTALAADLNCITPSSLGSRSSKFNIYPISSFGEQSSPEVVFIDPSGLELTVEDCSHASFARKELGNDSLLLRLSNGNTVGSYWTGSNFSVSDNWCLPDMAIFSLSTQDDAASKTTRQVARSFMSRHKVPSILVSQESLWDKPPLEHTTLDYLTPHICLESRKSSLGSAQIIRRIPVDFSTFINIDSGQMNRNLACLAAARGFLKPRLQECREESKRVTTKDPWSFGEIYDLLAADFKRDGLKGLNRYEYLAGLVVMLMSVLGMLVIGFGLTELLGASRVSNSRVFPTNVGTPSTSNIATPTPSSSIPLTLPSLSHPIPSAASSTAAAQIHSVQSLSTVSTDLASILLDAQRLEPNKSQQFKVHVLGDCHIVLRPPHWLSKMKRAPKLLFKVLRDNVEIDHEFTTIFEGVFALQIPREDAYGTLNVEVWTESKPVINEIFEVDFGSSWLKVAGWKKATRVLTDTVREDINLATTSLSIAYDQTKTGLSTFVKQQRKKVAAQKSAEKAILDSHIKVAARTKELIVGQTRDLQRSFSKGMLVARRNVSERVGVFTKELTIYAHSTSEMLSHQAKILTRGTNVENMRAVTHSLADLRKDQLRKNQKRVLKFWWALKGVPKQKPAKAKGRGSQPSS